MKKKVFEEALAHLKQQERLEGISLKDRKPPFSRPSDPFHSLIRSIIYQQLSGKAAGTILSRFLTLFKGEYPTPKQLLKISDEKLRSVGLSTQKTSYLKDLATRFLDGTINPELFPSMTDEEIREHLIRVKGIGRWTADMFLMFTLYRPDVLPTGDLAIQKGFQKLFNLRSLPDVQKMEKLAKSWSPYRTVASWYLWELMDNP